MSRNSITNKVQPGDGDPRHGMASTYTNHGCRCDDCKRANTQWQSRRREKRAILEPPVHGTASSYTNWACRCDDCRIAHTEIRREYIRKKKTT